MNASGLTPACSSLAARQNQFKQLLWKSCEYFWDILLLILTFFSLPNRDCQRCQACKNHSDSHRCHRCIIACLRSSALFGSLRGFGLLRSFSLLRLRSMAVCNREAFHRIAADCCSVSCYSILADTVVNLLSVFISGKTTERNAVPFSILVRLHLSCFHHDFPVILQQLDGDRCRAASIRIVLVFPDLLN